MRSHPQRAPPRSLEGTALAGFAYVQAGEYFLSEGDLVASVPTLNVSSNLVHTPLGGCIALQLVGAVRQWVEIRKCKQILVHTTGGIEPTKTDRFF
tara:strand:+ start:1029 stop:1316 length:288 start_codon:yes stop_codon:yes gene_type:complete